MRRDDPGEGKELYIPRLRVCIAVAFLVLLLSGCGIEEYIVLEKPVVEIYGSTTVDIKPSNSSYLLDAFGYDVYYRLFDTESAAGPITGVDDQLGSGSTSPSILIKRLKDAGFQPMASLNPNELIPSVVYPILNPILFGSSTDITFRFTLDGTGTIAVNNEPINFVIRRAVKKSNEYRTFGDTSFDTSDCVFSSSSQTPTEVYFRGYVVASGFIIGQFIPYFSEPSLIGVGAITLLSQ